MIGRKVKISAVSLAALVIFFFPAHKKVIDGPFTIESKNYGLYHKIFPKVSIVRYDADGKNNSGDEYQVQFTDDQISISRRDNSKGYSKIYFLKFRTIVPPSDINEKHSFPINPQPMTIYLTCKEIAEKNGFSVPEAPWEHKT